jgi:hypothetical protein
MPLRMAWILIVGGRSAFVSFARQADELLKIR